MRGRMALVAIIISSAVFVGVAVVGGESFGGECDIAKSLSEIAGHPTSWSSDDHTESYSYCSWTGIKCQKGTTLKKLVLDDAGLYGSLPASWSCLSSLEKLSLRRNNLTGTLPVNWSALSKMESLKLEWNMRVAGSLPEEWSAMGAMRILDIDFAGITGTLPESWSGLLKLKKLSLLNNTLTGTLPSAWSSLTELETLSIAGNLLTGTIPDGWTAMSSLKFVNILGNFIVHGALSDAWKTLGILESSPVDLPGFPAINMTRRNPQSTLSPNETESGALAVPPFSPDTSSEVPDGPSASAGIATALLEIGGHPAGWNNTTSYCIWEGITCNDDGSLNWIELANMGLKGPLPDAWSHFTGIKKIVLQRNDLNGTLPHSWSSLSNVKKLELQYNSLTGSLPAVWSAMTSLKSIDVRHNKLTGTLPDTWSAMKNANKIHLHYNDFQGSLPKPWSRLTNLKELNARDNSISGTLPESWSTMKSLSRMNFVNNTGKGGPGLRGTLPAAWSCLTSLSTMTLKHNELFGTMPPCWSALSSLKIMKLDTNNLQGSIPDAWSAMRAMHYMSLHTNTLVGTIPTTWTTMKDLNLVHVNHNRLSGSLPHSWSSLKMLKYIRMNDNNLEGSLPETWSKITTLHYMSLKGNLLTGTLPISWTAMKNLNTLIMYSNKLTGSLPEAWSSFQTLRVMSLASNAFVGRLPSSWSGLHRIGRLSLERNDLSGTLPVSWHGLSTLQQIDLGSNKLSGTLPSEWGVLLEVHEHPVDMEACRQIKADVSLHDDAYAGIPHCPWNKSVDNFFQPLCMTECNVLECGFDSNCKSAYGSSLTFGVQVGIGSNNLAGTIPESWLAGGGHDRLTADLSCLAGTRGGSQRFCPPPWLALSLAMGLPVPLSLAAWASGDTPAALLSRMANLQGLKDRWGGNLAWAAAVGLALTWNLFTLTPYFEDVVVIGMRENRRPFSSVLDVVFRSLAVTLQPPCMLLLLLWLCINSMQRLTRTGRSLSAAAACSWTIVASEDNLSENLDSIRVDQLVLVCLFLVLIPLTAALNFAALPSAIRQWISVEVHQVWIMDDIEPPVWLELSVRVPRVVFALANGSLLLFMYHIVACLSLPEHLWLNTAVQRAASSLEAYQVARKEGKHTAGMLWSVFWLRQAYWVALVSAGLFMVSTALSVHNLSTHFSERTMTGFDYFDWKAFKDTREPIDVHHGPLPVTLLSISLSAQIILAATWNILAWSPPGNSAAMGNPKAPEKQAPKTRGLGLLPAITRLHEAAIHRVLLLGILMLQMIPVLGSGPIGGWVLIGIVWGLTYSLLAATILIREQAGDFQSLVGSPQFGLVILASGLADVLEADLDLEDRQTPEERIRVEKPSHCCDDYDDAHLGGCPACQRLLPRYPATLFRMSQTLALSYRWQPDNRAILPLDKDSTGGITARKGGRAPQPGLKKGTAGINMSRWQREQLLAELRRGRYKYVWIDALSIPAAILGKDPDPGTWIVKLSGTLLTRMMGVYAAAAETLVLMTSEFPGQTYHERAWTFQEYCGARRIVAQFEQGHETESAWETTSPAGEHEISQAPMVTVVSSSENQLKRTCSLTQQEIFSKTRSDIQDSMRSALPVWLQRLLLDDGSHSIGRFAQGIQMYGYVKSMVGCQFPADRVRALVPLLLNSPVQDEDELIELVEKALACAKSILKTQDAIDAMEEARNLLGEAPGTGKGLASLATTTWPVSPCLAELNGPDHDVEDRLQISMFIGEFSASSMMSIKKTPTF